MKRRWRRIVLPSTTFLWWIRLEHELSPNEPVRYRRHQILCANPEGSPRHALRVRFPDSASWHSGWPHAGWLSPADAPERTLFLHHPSVVRAILEAALAHGFDPARSGTHSIDDGFVLFDEISRRHHALHKETVTPRPSTPSPSSAEIGSERHRADDMPQVEAGKLPAPRPDPGALSGLIAALRDGSGSSWIAEHTPSRDLEPLWHACRDAQLLLGLLERTDRLAAVRAACACARTVLHLVWPGNDHPRIAIETAEAWTRGESSAEQCGAAADAADGWDTDYPATSSGDAASAANAAAGAAAYAAAGEDPYDDPGGPAARSAARAASAIATANGHRWEREFDAALSALADVVRAVATCPRVVGHAEGPSGGESATPA